MRLDLQEFDKCLAREGLAKTTRRHHITRVKYFNRDLEAWTKKGIDNWVIDKIESGWTNNSINSYLKTIRKLGKHYNIPDFQATKFLTPNDTDKGVLSDDEIRAFLNYPCPYSPERMRWKQRYDMFSVFFSIMAYTGCRPIDCATLTVNDVDFGTGKIRFWMHKTKRYNYVPISVDLQPIVHDYVGKLEREALFTQCNQQNWSKYFKSRIALLGIKRSNLTVYSLRYSFATRLDNAGVGLRQIKDLMGHKKITTTDGYIKNSFATRKRTIAKDPLNKRTPDQALTSLLETVRELNLTSVAGLHFEMIERQGEVEIRARTNLCR